jgi:hypothetical protein
MRQIPMLRPLALAALLPWGAARGTQAAELEIQVGFPPEWGCIAAAGEDMAVPVDYKVNPGLWHMSLIAPPVG